MPSITMKNERQIKEAYFDISLYFTARNCFAASVRG
jgi:hypothetical protein